MYKLATFSLRQSHMCNVYIMCLFIINNNSTYNFFIFALGTFVAKMPLNAVIIQARVIGSERQYGHFKSNHELLTTKGCVKSEVSYANKHRGIEDTIKYCS